MDEAKKSGNDVYKLWEPIVGDSEWQLRQYATSAYVDSHLAVKDASSDANVHTGNPFSRTVRWFVSFSVGWAFATLQLID